MAEDQEVPELSEVTVAVQHLVSASRELSARTSRELGVNSTDMAALSLLEQNGPMGAVELATSLGIRSASVTVLIDRLERAGHAERVRSSTDRRRVMVATTPSAHRASLSAVLPTILAIDETSRGLDPDEERVVQRYLSAVTEAMRRSTPGG